ncbi:MAG TPA: hypothetical protein VIJ66_02445 [Solirubrobacteraceae bacterium]
MARSTLGRSLYKAARTVRTVEQVSKGKGARRAKNIAVGRTAGKAGLWRRLWR